MARIAQSTSCGAVAPPASQNVAKLRTRTYSPIDELRVAEICRNVYNGTDYLPRMIRHYADEPHTRILVAEESEHGGEVQGIVCSHQRGEAVFLLGLRVHEQARGKGVASVLMDRICEESLEPLDASAGGVRMLVSATIPQNAAALRIFERMGFVHTHTVDVFPSYLGLAEYEKAVGFVPGSGQQQQGRQLQQEPGQERRRRQPSMLDFLPGARELVDRLAAEGGLGEWVQCSSLEQLQGAVEGIRMQQIEQEPELQQLPPWAPLSWLPWTYEAWPLDTAWTKQRIANGDIWLLPCCPAQRLARSGSSGSGSSGSGSSSSSLSADSGGSALREEGGPCSGSGSSLASILSAGSGGGGRGGAGATEAAPEQQQQQQQQKQGKREQEQQAYAAAVVVARSPEFRRTCAGVLTAGDAAVAAALRLIDERAGHYVAFIDRGTRHSSGRPDPDVVLPELLASTGPPSCFTVVARPAAAGGC